MWPEYFYMSGLGKAAYVVLYLPAVLVISLVMYRLLIRHIQNGWLRWGSLSALALSIAAAPLLNVYTLSMEAQQLCRTQAGLHVYRVVEAEGFLGGGMDKYWAEHGFKYVESGGTHDRKFRDTMQDGKVVTTQVSEFVSRYQRQTGVDERVINKYMERTSSRVIDRQKQEVLGELVILLIYPGWLDNIALGLTGTGSGFHPWSCGDEPPPGRKDRLASDDVVLATIKPVSLNKGEEK